MSFLNCIILTLMFGFGFNKILPKLGNGSDLDALEFITNWESNTGAVMPETQRLAVNDWYRGMKGEGTTHGTDLLTIARSVNARIYILIPLDNLNASASAYELDAVSNGVLKGQYVNMVAGDFTPQGVIGGSLKHFNTGVAPNNYLQDNTSFAIYNRILNPTSGYVFGNRHDSSIFFGLLLRSTGLNYVGVNSTAIVNQTFTNDSYLRLQRNSPTSFEIYRDGGLISSINAVSNTPSPGDIYANATSITTSAGGSSTAPSVSQLCYYEIGLSSLTANQNTDLFTVTQRLQSNVITGGRQIGTAIPPIS